MPFDAGMADGGADAANNVDAAVVGPVVQCTMETGVWEAECFEGGTRRFDLIARCSTKGAVSGIAATCDSSGNLVACPTPTYPLCSDE